MYNMIDANPQKPIRFHTKQLHVSDRAMSYILRRGQHMAKKNKESCLACTGEVGKLTPAMIFYCAVMSIYMYA